MRAFSLVTFFSFPHLSFDLQVREVCKISFCLVSRLVLGAPSVRFVHTSSYTGSPVTFTGISPGSLEVSPPHQGGPSLPLRFSTRALRGFHPGREAVTGMFVEVTFVIAFTRIRRKHRDSLAACDCVCRACQKLAPSWSALEFRRRAMPCRFRGRKGLAIIILLTHRPC